MANTYKKISIGGSGGTDDKRLKVSGDDSTSGYLEEKLVVGSTKLSKVILNNGSNEILELDVDQSQIDHDQLLNYEADEHAPLDDLSTSSTSLWSSDKVQTELDGKINAATPIIDNTILKSVGTSGVDVEATGIVVDDSDNVTGINNLTIDGDLTVNGTTTTVNSATLEVTDANITLNDGGTQASADSQDAGLTIEMSDATDAVFGYDSTTTSKFKIGESGDLREVASISHAQTFSNKTIDANANTISNIDTTNLEAGVLTTDLNNAVDDTNIPSSQSVKDYIAQEIATVDEASEISYSNLSSGLSATNVQDAIDEVEGRLDSAETSLSNHLNSGSGKHSSDQINYDNATSGLTATDVKAAIDELSSEKLDASDYDAEFDSSFASKDTDDLSEGSSNQYFTDERAQDAIGNILSDSLSIDVTYTDAAPDISFAVKPAGVNHDALQNYVANEHIDHSSVEIATGIDSGLTGGGDITSTRNLSVDITGTSAETSVAGDDEILIYDKSASALKKVTRANLVQGAGGNLSSGDILETSAVLSDNQGTFADVTGFAFNNGTVRSFSSQVAIERGSGFEVIEITGIQQSSDWSIVVSRFGDDTGVEFAITSAGQIQYTSTSTGNAPTIKFRADTLTV